MIPPRWGDEWLRFLGLGEIVINGMYDGSVVSKNVPPHTRRAEGASGSRRMATRYGYPLHIHASHDSTAKAILDVFEAVDKNVRIAPLRWGISHIEDAS